MKKTANFLQFTGGVRRGGGWERRPISRAAQAMFAARKEKRAFNKNGETVNEKTANCP